MLIATFVILALASLYVLSTVGRTGHKGFSQLENWSYAHRGLHGDGAPENSLEAFRRAKEAGYGSELDVHLLSDGNLAVIHDSSLERVTGRSGVVEDLTVEDLPKCCLVNTTQSIPTLQSVLDLYEGKAPLIVELKCYNSNYKELCEKTCQLLDQYDGVYCLESFDPRCVFWLRRHRPDLIRGQLAQNYLSDPPSSIPWIVRFVMSNHMLNFLTYPDFVAYRCNDRKQFSTNLCRKLWGIKGVAWTIQSRDEYDAACAEGWIPIFENFTP